MRPKPARPERPGRIIIRDFMEEALPGADELTVATRRRPHRNDADAGRQQLLRDPADGRGDRHLRDAMADMFCAYLAGLSN